MTLQRSEFVLIRYLREEKPHGSAGGLYNFKDLLMEEDPVIHSTPLFLWANCYLLLFLFLGFLINLCNLQTFFSWRFVVQEHWDSTVKRQQSLTLAFWLCTWIDCWKKFLLFYHGAHHHVWTMIFLGFCSMIFLCWTAMCAAAFL